MTDIIILSYCNDAEIFEMNCNCIKSLIESETKHQFNIVIIESNKNFGKLDFKYDYTIDLLIPEYEFNFNKFLNIGIKHTNNQLICFCNNDLIFEKNWYSEILKVKQQNSKIQSFCPVNPGFNDVKPKDYYLGHRVRKEFVGNCFLIERKVFETIGLFDEQFEFYQQDDDFAMILRKYDIIHALVPASKVIHLGAKTNRSGFGYGERIETDRKKYHKKWGSQRLIAYKNRLMSILRCFSLGHLSRYIY